MAANFQLAQSNMKNKGNANDLFILQIKTKSDKLINYFLGAYFLIGLLLAGFYDTWLVAIGIGSLSLLAYYSTKVLFPKSNAYQYMLSVVIGIFMAQFIYQMHGLFEMHFFAFIGSAVLITYQKWKLQIPLLLIVLVHHAAFGYSQFIGIDSVYFTQLDYMDLGTFIMHTILAGIIFFICGLWAYHFKKYSDILLKTNSELDKFVYSVSHDLRAPLASINGVIELAESDTSDPVLQERFALMKGSIHKLDSFIKDILDYSRNARVAVNNEQINFQEMLTEITGNLKYMEHHQRMVDIKINVMNELEFRSDRSRLNIVLNNLISNAIRYQDPNAENPYVDIRVDTSDTETSIVIKDNGIGIQKENQEKIFDMFYRVSNKTAGSGLGLYIVKEAVDTLNGRIEVESEPGKGTSFNIRIPNN